MSNAVLVDKNIPQSLQTDEVYRLIEVYTLVITPILIEELQSMLAKEPEKNKNWEEILSAIAKKSYNNSFILPEARWLARQSMLGDEIPMNGSIPLVGGKIIRRRDGSYGHFYDVDKSKKNFEGLG